MLTVAQWLQPLRLPPVQSDPDQSDSRPVLWGCNGIAATVGYPRPLTVPAPVFFSRGAPFQLFFLALSRRSSAEGNLASSRARPPSQGATPTPNCFFFFSSSSAKCRLAFCNSLARRSANRPSFARLLISCFRHILIVISSDFGLS